MKERIHPTLRYILFFTLAALCVTPIIDPPIALLIGFVFAETIGHPFPAINSKIAGQLLKVSVVGLGFGISLDGAIEVGKEGFLLVATVIGSALLFGYFLGRLLKVPGVITFLVSSGTAICGGSAIAALSPIVNADQKQMSVSLGIVFILNSVALLSFPYIGQFLDMSQANFGLWCAIAIHDTSSVVGAAAKYGEEALQVATTTKLGRTLWLIPLSIAAIIVVRSTSKKIRFPFFVGFFILAMVVSTYLPDYSDLYGGIKWLAKRGLVLTLFLIGSGLSMKLIKSVGLKPMLHGVVLWVIVAVGTLLLITMSG